MVTLVCFQSFADIIMNDLHFGQKYHHPLKYCFNSRNIDKIATIQ